VSKTIAAARVAEALAAGVVDLGENRAQELLAKAAEIGARSRWHFIGQLQRNKIAALARVVDTWHSIDRVGLVEPLARHAPGARLLVQVNLSGEPQKGGCPPGETGALVGRLRDAGLVVDGLMTVPAAEGDPRPTFAALREMGDSLQLPELSMGMTGDFEAAIGEGATIVRIGSAIFGPRSGAAGLRR
jgi:hypothetical protein